MPVAITAPKQIAPGLRRALGLWDLVLYGIVVIQPTAPMPVFGVVSERAHGHVATAVLIAMVQRWLMAPGAPDVENLSRALTYQALVNPAK